MFIILKCKCQILWVWDTDVSSLWRMGLKDKQEREIVHVLMDCCLQEKTFNAFYAVLGQKFCSHDRRFQVRRRRLSFHGFPRVLCSLIGWTHLDKQSAASKQSAMCSVCATTQPPQLCVTCLSPPHCGNFSHPSPLISFLSNGDDKQHFLLRCQVDLLLLLPNWCPLSSSKGLKLSRWESLLFTCNLGVDERITHVEPDVNHFFFFFPSLLWLISVLSIIHLSVMSFKLIFRVVSLCSQMTFQFSLWDKFRELPNLPSSTFNNLIQLVTRFLQNKCLPLSILKVRDFFFVVVVFSSFCRLWTWM